MGRLRDLIYGGDRTDWDLLERAAARAPRQVAPAPAAPETSQPPGQPLAIEDLIAEQVARRSSTFTLADALKMPPVIRAVQLICSQVAQFLPVAYRDGVPLELQPRLLTQPAPWGSRYQFLYQTVYSWLAVPGTAGTGGDAYWRVAERDDEGIARSMYVVDPAEVQIDWDDAQFLPVYRWRGRKVGTRAGEIPADDWIHLTIGRPPGQLHGRSPLIAGLEALGVVAAAEAYALGFFMSSGVPSVAINVPGKIDPAEAARLKAQWMAAHAGPEATPAVLSNGMTADYPPVDAQRAQLQEARTHGTTITAILLGIPAPLLHVSTSGATITYNSAGGALDEFVRATAQPVYLAPLEGYLSALVPRTQTVRFDTGELNRIDIAGRMNVYATGIGAGVLQPAEARIREGWPAAEPITSDPTYAATPALPQLAAEVPARV